jgi:hypothetical protein
MNRQDQKFIMTLTLLLFTTSCSIGPKSKSVLNPNHDLAIEEKADDYCQLSTDLEDSFGWVGKCGDQMLFNSLRVVACDNVRTDIYRARNPDTGEWNRDGARTCYERGETATRFSRDMLIGLMFRIFQDGSKEALGIAQQLVSYLKSHDWYLCEAKEPLRTSRCYVNPGLKSTIYELVYQLGGEDNPARRFEPIFAPSKGYEAHLAVLHITLRGMMRGSITYFQKEALRYQKNRQPRNLLFRTAFAKFDDGRMDGIVKELKAMDSLFPDSRLPGAGDRCEPYLWQRDTSSADWLPCVRQNHVHPGIDYAFLAALINDKIRHTKLFTVPEGEVSYKPKIEF